MPLFCVTKLTLDNLDNCEIFKSLEIELFLISIVLFSSSFKITSFCSWFAVDFLVLEEFIFLVTFSHLGQMVDFRLFSLLELCFDLLFKTFIHFKGPKIIFDSLGAEQTISSEPKILISAQLLRVIFGFLKSWTLLISVFFEEFRSCSIEVIFE